MHKVLVVSMRCFNRCKKSGKNEDISPLFDNFVDSIAQPTIIVTPYADGALPRYLVAFHKEAL